MADATTRDLAEWARAYTHGDLSDADAAAFEDRLALDQRARDALVAAVQGRVGPDADTLRPDPAYRQEVIRRLSPHPWWAWLTRTFAAPSPRVRWGLAGAALALTLLFGTWMQPAAPDVAAPVVVQQPSVPPSAVVREPGKSTERLARFWSDLPRGDHLVKAIEEETARKAQFDLVRPGRPEATASLRPEGPMMP